MYFIFIYQSFCQAQAYFWGSNYLWLQSLYIFMIDSNPVNSSKCYEIYIRTISVTSFPHNWSSLLFLEIDVSKFRRSKIRHSKIFGNKYNSFAKSK